MDVAVVAEAKGAGDEGEAVVLPLQMLRPPIPASQLKE